MKKININFSSYFSLNNKASRIALVKHLEQVAIESIYDYVLDLQTQATSRDDFLFFSNQSAWNKVKSIADLGCGAGHYLNFLSSFFPKKKFVGVDINKGFIDRAKKRFQKAGTFICDNICFFNISKFDYVIVRATLQHLTDDQYFTFIRSLERWINPTTRIAFFDHDPDLKIIYHPAVPSIVQMHRILVKAQKKKGGDRFRLQHFIDNCSHFGFEIELLEKPRYACINNFDKNIFAHYELAKASLISKMFNIKIDLTTMAQEIAAWLKTPYSYAIEGCGQWVVVKKKS